MKVLGIIPARYQSSRYPGKLLSNLSGKTIIRRVYECAQKSHCLDKLVIATDHHNIYDHVKDFAEVLMTSTKHRNGTERCAEVLDQLPDYDVIINIQGDEPFLDPSQIEELAHCFEDKKSDIATLVKKINHSSELFNPSIAKTVFDQNMFALYFSRGPIPYIADVEKSQWTQHFDYYKHIGIYGYRANILKEIVTLPPSPYELAEKHEQMRWIEFGYKIKVSFSDYESLSIDTIEDMKAAEEYLKNNPEKN